MSPLRKRFIEEMKLLSLSKNTSIAYLRAVVKLSEFYNKSPLNITNEEIRKFLLSLRERLAIKSYNVYIAGLHCFFKTMAPSREILPLKQIKPPIIFPEVFSTNEVHKLLETVESLKYKTIFTLMYSSGLRVGECVNLKPENIDSQRMLIHVQQGKGQKDRNTILSKYALVLLQNYFKTFRPKQWLFEGFSKSKPLHIRSIQNVFKKAIKASGIKKKVRPHTLRHSFATHLLEQKCPLPVIQKFLGHKDLKTTLLYTHITSGILEDVKSPLDTLLEQTNNGGKSNV